MGLEFVGTRDGIKVTELNELFEKVLLDAVFLCSAAWCVAGMAFTCTQLSVFLPSPKARSLAVLVAYTGVAAGGKGAIYEAPATVAQKLSDPQVTLVQQVPSRRVPSSIVRTHWLHMWCMCKYADTPAGICTLCEPYMP